MLEVSPGGHFVPVVVPCHAPIYLITDSLEVVPHRVQLVFTVPQFLDECDAASCLGGNKRR